MNLVLFLPPLLLLPILAGCGTTGTPMTEEARCRQSGGVWRTASEMCEQAGGGGGY